MTTTESIIEAYEEKRRLVSRFQLTSDIFFGKVMEYKPACEEFIKILLGRPVTVQDVKSQYSIRNIETHSVTLDIFAEITEQAESEAAPCQIKNRPYKRRQTELVNIEMQVSEQEDHLRRTRYHQSCIDVSTLEKGTAYANLPELYLFFITEKDFIGEGNAIYSIQRTFNSHPQTLDNGIHEIYVNLNGSTSDKALAELLAYIRDSDSSHETEYFPNLVRQVRFLKEETEGIDSMCNIINELQKTAREEGIIEGKRKGIELGISSLIRTLHEFKLDDDSILAKLMSDFLLTESDAKEALNRYS